MLGCISFQDQIHVPNGKGPIISKFAGNNYLDIKEHLFKSLAPLCCIMHYCSAYATTALTILRKKSLSDANWLVSDVSLNGSGLL